MIKSWVLWKTKHDKKCLYCAGQEFYFFYYTTMNMYLFFTHVIFYKKKLNQCYFRFWFRTIAVTHGVSQHFQGWFRTIVDYPRSVSTLSRFSLDFNWHRPVIWHAYCIAYFSKSQPRAHWSAFNCAIDCHAFYCFYFGLSVCHVWFERMITKTETWFVKATICAYINRMD